MRAGNVQTAKDEAGEYEIEIFETVHPKSVVVCAHGNGVRRWDGEKFFYNLADHYPDSTFLLADQNQLYKDGVALNDIEIQTSRIQSLIDKAGMDYPNVPIIAIGHSMGCGILARAELAAVSKVIFISPAAGDENSNMLKRFGPEVFEGKEEQTSEGKAKFITKAYVESVRGIVWEKEYEKLLETFMQVYAFESGDEEIVSDERLKHREMKFAGYTIIPGAKHNYAGEPLQKLFEELDKIL
jgi:hypothetical protein